MTRSVRQAKDCYLSRLALLLNLQNSPENFQVTMKTSIGFLPSFIHSYQDDNHLDSDWVLLFLSEGLLQVIGVELMAVAGHLSQSVESLNYRLRF